MRAVVLRDGTLEVRSTADPTPGPGELLLKTLSTAICASDVHFMDHPELGINDPTGRSLYDADRDIVMGHEFVGEVVGHGPGCTEELPVGTRVTSMPMRLVDGGVAAGDRRSPTSRRRTRPRFSATAATTFAESSTKRWRNTGPNVRKLAYRIP